MATPHVIAMIFWWVQLMYGSDPVVVEGAEVGAITKAKVAVFVTGGRRKLTRRAGVVVPVVVPVAG